MLTTPPSSAPATPTAASADPLTHKTTPQSLNPSRLLCLILPLLLVLLLSSPVLFSQLPRLLTPSTSSSLDASRDPATVCLLAACRDCHAVLPRALTSWARVRHLSSVVFVDWGSTPPLNDTVQTLLALHNHSSSTLAFPSLRVVRVSASGPLIDSIALNLAARLAQAHSLLLVAHDTLLHPETLAAHHSSSFPDDVLRDTAAATLLLPAPAFAAAGGLDERLQHGTAYLHDDLLSRLPNTFTTTELRPGYATRARARRRNGVQKELQRRLLRMLDDPWTSDSPTAILAERPDGFALMSAPRSVEAALGNTTAIATTRAHVVRADLAESFNVPTSLAHALPPAEADKLLYNMEAGRNASAPPPRLVVVHVQNGLGNRLRVLGSGVAYARLTGREPVIVWEEDIHFGASFGDLFNASHFELPIVPHFSAASNRDFSIYDYTKDRGSHRNLPATDRRHIYFKSASIAASDIQGLTWEAENEALTRLVPTDAVLTLVNDTLRGLAGYGRLAGAHVRNRSLDTDIIGAEDNRALYRPHAIADIDRWRPYTTVANFLPAVRGLLRNGSINHLFIASDTAEVCRQLQNALGTTSVSFIERGDCDARTARCLEYALADALVLARTDPLLGSTWSSFTELAMRLGAPKALMAGTDFGDTPL